MSLGLLARHVAGGSQDRTGARQIARSVEVASHTQVEQHDIVDPPVPQEQVRWLDVSVDDAATVRDAQAAKGPAQERQALEQAEGWRARRSATVSPSSHSVAR